MTIQFIAGSAHLLVTVAAPGQSLADFLLTQVDDSRHVHQLPFVSD